MAAMSAGNAAIVGFVMKKYTKVKNLNIFGASVAMYAFSYYFSTKGIDKEEDQLNTYLIEKYHKQYQSNQS